MKKQEENNKLFDSIKEDEISFPIYYKNRRGNMYTCLLNEDKFEQLTTSTDGESFRGSILFGFNEQFKLYKDIKLMYHSIIRMNSIITPDEYDTIFNAIQQGRQEFFSEDKYEYIEPVHQLTQDQLNKYIKHKWKKPQP